MPPHGYRGVLLEGAANTHLTHLEELVLTQGPDGYNMARAFLLELLKTLKGNSESRIQTSVKWDGAPAIFAGINPENGKFFVGTKSIFNKVPKINYTEEDIIQNHGHAPGLVDKLTRALKHLPKLGITNILQGDFMFDDSMLEVAEIDGEPHYRFKPNTIVYAVPVNSELGRKIGQSEFGIVFHTTYDSLDSGASFGADISNLNQAPGVWFDDAFFTDDTGTVTLTEDEEQRIIQLVESADSVNQRINYNDLPLALLNIYINSEIKGGHFIEDAEKSFDGFLSWYKERLRKRVEKLKSERGQNRAINKGQQDISNFEGRREDFLNLFRVSRLLFEAKNIFIEKYNNAVYNTKHFVDDGSGDLVASNPEGYVAVDHEGNGVKFVDRLEFSRANFMVDKGDKFTNESTNFTINVSKDVKITKTLKEWAYEIKKAGHVPGNVPSFVYNELINGGLVVESVREEDAQEVIYNTVYAYINSLNEEETIDLEVVDAADADGVPVEASVGTTYALVPGSMKPPTLGHAGMIEAYSDMVGPNGRVLVFVSTPTARHKKTGKLSSARSFEGRPEGISQQEAMDILKIMLPEELLAPEGNVEIVKTSHASPMTPVYEFVSPNDIEDAQQAVAGDVVILGASTKGGDADRWNDIVNNADTRVRTGVEVRNAPVDPVTHSIHQGGIDYLDLIKTPEAREILETLPTVVKYKKQLAKIAKKSGGSAPEIDINDIDISNISASDARHVMGFLGTDKKEMAIQLLNAFFGDATADVLAHLGLSGPPDVSLEETSMASGAIGGAAVGSRGAGTGPFGRSTPGKRDSKKKNRKKKNENIDMSLVNEVYELLIERGIKL